MKAKVHPERFAVVKTDEIPENFFAIVKLSEITAVIPEGAMEDLKVKEVEFGFRLITFEANLPFDTVGFISKISRALAEANIPILVFSSYHTDHILIKEDFVERAIETLRNIGFVVEEG
ncbi:ACT domain-containing protein [Archaeoglobus sp.]